MLPSEMVILMAIAVNKNTGRQLLTRPSDVTGEYIGYLYHSLVKRGYLKMLSPANYQLTQLGRNIVCEFLNKNGTMAKDVIKRLQTVGIEISPKEEQKVGGLKKISN